MVNELHEARDEKRLLRLQRQLAGYKLLIVVSLQRPSSADRNAAKGTWLAPIAAVEYLEAALAFASNHGLGMAIAQLDLTNWTSGCIDRARHGAV